MKKKDWRNKYKRILKMTISVGLHSKKRLGSPKKLSSQKCSFLSKALK